MKIRYKEKELKKICILIKNTEYQKITNHPNSNHGLFLIIIKFSDYGFKQFKKTQCLERGLERELERDAVSVLFQVLNFKKVLQKTTVQKTTVRTPTGCLLIIPIGLLMGHQPVIGGSPATLGGAVPGSRLLLKLS